MDNNEIATKRPRGFAALSLEDRKRIASMGGIAAHIKGTAHQFTTEEAVKAGRKRGFLSKQSVNSPHENEDKSAPSN
jgi:hypothetical protein